MKASFKKALASIAAAAMALCGMAVGATSAMADDTVYNPNPTKGSLTINNASDDTVPSHTFDGYLLATLTYVKASTDSTTNVTKLDSFTVKTNSAYTAAVEAVMGKIADPSDSAKTLADGYKNDKGYYTRDATTNNPMGYMIANYSEDESSSPWGYKSDAAATVLRQFTDKLADYVNTNSVAATTTSLKTGANTDIAAGVYLLRQTDSLAQKSGKPITSAAMIASTSYQLTGTVTATKDNAGTELGTINLKATYPTIYKEVVKDNTSTDTNNSKNDPDYNIGDTVYYRLYATMPDFKGSDTTGDTARVLKINDVAEPGLTINKVEWVKVGDTLSTATILAETTGSANPKDYTATITPGITAPDSYKGGTETVIDLANYVNQGTGATPADFEKSDATNYVAPGTLITVLINATLNRSAKVSSIDASGDTVTRNVQPNKNKTSLDFARTSNSTTDKHNIPGGAVNVYTFKFNVTKKNKNGNKLAGAEFIIKDGDHQLYLDDNATPSVPTDDGWTTDNTAPGHTYTGTFTTTASDGTVTFDGLKAGTYTIQETKAPTGYLNALLPSFTVTITPGTETGTSGNYTADTATVMTGRTDATWGDDTLSTFNVTNRADANELVTKNETSNNGNVEVKNVKSITQLPKTGAAGIAFFSFIGLALIAAAAFFAIRARKAAKIA